MVEEMDTFLTIGALGARRLGLDDRIDKGADIAGNLLLA